MTNPLDHIDKLCAWLGETDIGILELAGPTRRLRLLHQGDSVAREIVGEAAATGDASSTIIVGAPAVGVFLDRHPLRLEPIAPVGADKLAGAPLGFLRVGQLLAAVAAPRDGIVMDVLVEHGTLVGYGTALFELKPTQGEAGP
jgi:acetyl-CoA carboxylase biotin carboxyl carrier protein